MTSYRRASIRLAQQFKRVGGTKADYIKLKMEVIESTARLEGWLPSERAVALAEVEMLAAEVWSKEK
jgi:hypothetical protein